MTTALLMCECGEPLTGRQTVRCSLCTMKESAGSSQCPHCLEWYYTHSGNVKRDVLELHAKGKCKRDRR